MDRIRLGVSACLLGQSVRWDGNHARDAFVADVLGPYVEYVPVCPEVEAGFGIPRPPMRLVGDPSHPRLVLSGSGVDQTERMESWAAGRVAQLADEGLHGFIFKKGSPSSGMERVKVYPGGDGPPVRRGQGVFARIFMERFPLLPVEEEGRLNDPVLRENFIERLFALARWRDFRREASRGGLVTFHTTHKLLLLSHSTEHYRTLGRLVAGAAARPLPEVLAEYEHLLLTALKLIATRKKHRNVLQHALGYFKKVLTPDEKQEMLEVIDGYAAGGLPLIVPITLLGHHVRRYQEPYLSTQVYLSPHPLELRLRNHA